MINTSGAITRVWSRSRYVLAAEQAPRRSTPTQKTGPGTSTARSKADAKKKAGNVSVGTGRGTGSRKLKDIPEPAERPSTEGMTRTTGRGTGSRKSKNKGS